MIRALLDRMLFILPPLPSRASLLRGGGYAAFGILLYGLFLGLFSLREFGVVGLRQWCETRPGMHIVMSSPELAFFPPKLTISELLVQPRMASSPLAFRHVRASLALFPPGISIQADIAGGQLDATVLPSPFWGPDLLNIQAQFSGVEGESLLRPFLGNVTLLQVNGGTLDGSTVFELPLQNGRTLEGGGTLELALQGGVIELGLPMLKTSRLDTIKGSLVANWKKERLTLQQIELKNPLFACTVQGQISLAPQDIPASQMDIQSVLRISPDQLQEAFMPERTLRSIKDKGEVRVHIRDTFRSPSFDVLS